MAETVPEMTFNQALQEVTKFKNTWASAMRLEEALLVAAKAENAMGRLQQEHDRLENLVKRMEENWEFVRKDTAAKIAAERAVADQELEKLKALEKQREDEFAGRLAKKEAEVNQAIEQLTLTLGTKQAAVLREAEGLDEQIESKQSLIADLNEQLEALRARLG